MAVCDVYEPHAGGRRRSGREHGCQSYSDFRKVLERKDIDAVLVATPDHWHAGVTVLACQAGKDVYVEKPLGHNIREGRKMVEAARRHNRVVQTGTQHRSAPHIQRAAEIVRSGQIRPCSLRARLELPQHVAGRHRPSPPTPRRPPASTGTSISVPPRRFRSTRIDSSSVPLVLGLCRRHGSRITERIAWIASTRSWARRLRDRPWPPADVSS